MTAHLARKLATVGAAVAAALLAQPACAAPVSLRGFAAQEMRLETIAYRMGAATANMCSDHTMLTGLLFHDLSQYDPGIRPAVASAFSLDDGVGVIQIVPGSAADRAGLRIDDEIVAIGGRSVRDPSAALQRRKSSARVEQVEAMLRAALEHGPTELVVRRRGNLIELPFAAEQGCGGELALVNSGDTNAWSDGNRVVLTTAIVQLARNDDEIAFVVAHEMAHNILGHSRSSSPRLFGMGLGFSRARRSELDADQLAVQLMRDGGYRAEAGVTFLHTASRALWWDFSLDHPGFGTRIRAVNAAIAAMDSGPVLAKAAATRAVPAMVRGRTIAAAAQPVQPPLRDYRPRVELAEIRWPRVQPAYSRAGQTRCDY
jgi:Peptidase family M48/PDZ domain